MLTNLYYGIKLYNITTISHPVEWFQSEEKGGDW